MGTGASGHESSNDDERSSAPPTDAESGRIVVWLTHDSVEAWNFDRRHAEALERGLPGAEVVIASSRDEFLAALPTARIALIWRFEDPWFAEAPALEWICTPAAGRDLFRVEPPPGVAIDYGAFHGELMAETVVGMMLALSRGILASERSRPTAAWPLPEVQAAMRPLRGSHLVIVGFGAIGRWIGRLARPFGVRVTGVRRDSTAARPAWMESDDRVVPASALDSVLPEADHLVLSLPGEGTRHILDDRRLRLLPAKALVYNVGRGSAIDEQALATALAEKRIAGAGLDVFETEPLPADSPLRDCPRALLLPHASAISPNYLDLFVAEFISRYQGRYGLPGGTA